MNETDEFIEFLNNFYVNLFDEWKTSVIKQKPRILKIIEQIQNKYCFFKKNNLSLQKNRNMYAIVVTREKLCPNDYIRHITELFPETTVEYADLSEATRAFQRAIGFQYINERYDVFVYLVEYRPCGCERVVVEILKCHKTVKQQDICNNNTIPQLTGFAECPNEIGVILNSPITIQYDVLVPNGDNFVIVCSQPTYGNLVSYNNNELIYTVSDSPVNDTINISAVNLITGCFTTKRICLTTI